MLPIGLIRHTCAQGTLRDTAHLQKIPILPARKAFSTAPRLSGCGYDHFFQQGY